MKFGAIAVGDAAGAILAHTTRVADRVLKKGRVLSSDDAAALAASGLHDVICARLEPGELGEDAAAASIGGVVAGDRIRVEHTHTGRTNLYATGDGLVVIEREAIAAANRIDEAITIATVAPDTPVRAGDMIATVKIIPFGVAGASVIAAGAAARGAVEVRAWRPRRAGLVLTRIPGAADSVLDRAAVAQRTRLERCGGTLASELRVAHDVAAVADALTRFASDQIDPMLVLGGSAIMDRADVIPSALERAGGRIVRLGMPVDPGNLLLLGELRGATVIGVPGCARSLKRSGFDRVLERTCAGVPVTGDELAAMGVGGLLDEISVRSSPRDGAAATPDQRRVAAIVLAAGRGSRMGSNKLVAELDGEPIVRRTVGAVLASRARPVVVVTGHEAEAVRGALAGLDVAFAHNPSWADGMSTSLRVGLAAVGEVDGALICLGDMPRLAAHHLDAVIAAFVDDATIVVPTCDRKRGNPVLWPRRYFAEISALTGDVGARALVDRYADQVRFLQLDDPAILVDVDTPAALAELRRDR